MATIEVPGFRKPWEGGARAYPEADTFEAARAGFRRRRKNVMFHMPNAGEAGMKKCVVCGGFLSEPSLAVERKNLVLTQSTTRDRFSTWTYSVKHKDVGNGQHYVCSWGSLMVGIFSLPS